jgi:DNA invertase Pin-like site-specific DNA recombinase
VIVRPVYGQVNRIYGYIRQSHSEHRFPDLAVERQKKLITKFCANKYERAVDEFFIDHPCTGTVDILDREASRAMTDVVDQHDVIIATRLDRLSRSVDNLLTIIPQLQEVGVDLYFCEQFGDFPVAYRKPERIKGIEHHVDFSDQIHQAFLMALKAADGLARARELDIIEDGRMEWAAKGYYLGGRLPYGYKTEGVEIDGKIRKRLLPDPEQQRWIEVMKKMRKRKLSYHQIAKQMNSLQKDRKFHYKSIERILLPRRGLQAVTKE